MCPSGKLKPLFFAGAAVRAERPAGILVSSGSHFFDHRIRAESQFLRGLFFSQDFGTADGISPKAKFGFTPPVVSFGAC